MKNFDFIYENFYRLFLTGLLINIYPTRLVTRSDRFLFLNTLISLDYIPLDRVGYLVIDLRDTSTRKQRSHHFKVQVKLPHATCL